MPEQTDPPSLELVFEEQEELSYKAVLRGKFSCIKPTTSDLRLPMLDVLWLESHRASSAELKSNFADLSSSGSSLCVDSVE